MGFFGLLTDFGTHVGLLASILLIVLVCLAVRATFNILYNPWSALLVIAIVILITGLTKAGVF